MLAGTGGSETFTAGYVRKLLRRGIQAQVVTVGHGTCTVLKMMHQHETVMLDVHMSTVMAGQYVEAGRTIARMLRGYRYATLLEPRKTVTSMAALLAKTGILLMPSVFAEPFGMLSVEVQHSGYRVISQQSGRITGD